MNTKRPFCKSKLFSRWETCNHSLLELVLELDDAFILKNSFI
jgi:hypothetical protein